MKPPTPNRLLCGLLALILGAHAAPIGPISTVISRDISEPSSKNTFEPRACAKPSCDHYSPCYDPHRCSSAQAPAPVTIRAPGLLDNVKRDDPVAPKSNAAIKDHHCATFSCIEENPCFDPHRCKPPRARAPLDDQQTQHVSDTQTRSERGNALVGRQHVTCIAPSCDPKSPCYAGRTKCHPPRLVEKAAMAPPGLVGLVAPGCVVASCDPHSPCYGGDAGCPRSVGEKDKHLERDAQPGAVDAQEPRSERDKELASRQNHHCGVPNCYPKSQCYAGRKKCGPPVTEKNHQPRTEKPDGVQGPENPTCVVPSCNPYGPCYSGDRRCRHAVREEDVQREREVEAHTRDIQRRSEDAGQLLARKRCGIRNCYPKSQCYAGRDKCKPPSVIEKAIEPRPGGENELASRQGPMCRLRTCNPKSPCYAGRNKCGPPVTEKVEARPGSGYA